MVKVWTAASTRAGVPSQGEGMQCSLEGGTASLASSQSMSVCRWHQEGGQGMGGGRGRGWGRQESLEEGTEGHEQDGGANRA